MKGIGCEMRDARHNVNEGNDTQAGKRNEQQHGLTRTSSAAYNCFATRTPRMFVADEIPADGEHNEYEFRYRRGHSLWSCGVRSDDKLALCPGMSAFREPSSPIADRAPSGDRI